MVKLDEQWVEVLALFFLVIGFILAISLQNAYFSYFSTILAAFVAGRVYYLKYRKEPIFPFILIIAGFLVGNLIAGIWVNRVIMLLVFVIGFMGSYYLHLKQILVTFKNKSFIK